MDPSESGLYSCMMLFQTFISWTKHRVISHSLKNLVCLGWGWEFRLFDDIWRLETTHLYLHDFKGHARRVTDVLLGYGGCNALIVSASEDQTCKVHLLSSDIYVGEKINLNLIF